MTPRPIGEDDLHAYVDGALSTDRLAEVEAWLNAHPEQRERVAAYERHREQIRAVFDPVLQEPTPIRLGLPLRTEHRPAWAATRGWAAAVVAALFVGGAGGWGLHAWTTPQQRGIAALAQEAATTYAVYAPDTSRAIELPASDSVRLNRWISERIGRDVQAPNLEPAGFRLLGGRLAATPHGPAGLFLYEDARGVRLAILARPMEVDQSAPMRRHSIHDTEGMAWADHGLGFSMVGPTDLDGDLARLAREARRQTLALTGV